MSDWTTVCAESDLVVNTGVCAKLDEDQVAVFCVGKQRDLYAVSNYDPIGEANVMSRGIVGSLGDDVVVASPLYKQHFKLETGECLENAEAALKVYSVRVEGGQVQIQN